MKTINLGIYGIEVVTDKGNGTIKSTLHDDNGSSEFNAAIDGLESLILAHACASVDISALSYQSGIVSAVDAICNNLS